MPNPLRPIVISFAALTCAASGFGADLPEVKAAGVLRVIVAADEDPATFAMEAGPTPGFERELVEGFAKAQGLTVTTVPVKTHADRIPALQAGKGDVIAAIFDTPERREVVAFTAEVMPTHNVAVTVAPRPPVASVEELRKLKVGVIVGTQPAEAALAAGVPASSLHTYAKMGELLEGLRSGAVASAVLPVSELALAGRKFPGLQAGTTVGESGVVAWAVRKEDARLKAALDDYLANTRKAGSWHRLVLKYFGQETLNVLGRSK